MILGRSASYSTFLLLIWSAVAAAQSSSPPSLLSAAYEGDAAKIRTLISDEHADVNAANDDGVTALMIAAGANKIEAMNVLIRSHADVDKKTKSGNTALIFAIGKGNKEAVGILLAAGASTSAKTPDGLTLVELANHKQQTEIAQLLTESIATGGPPSSGPIYKPRTFRVDPQAQQKPEEPNSELVAALESFKQTLLSSGRVEYGFPRMTETDGKPVRNVEQTRSVVPDARACQAIVHVDFSHQGIVRDRRISLFFESIDSVEVTSSPDARPTVYDLIINGNKLEHVLTFASEKQASEAAEVINRAARICRGAPVAVNAAAGAPNLADTLHFIEEKLNDNGAVHYLSSYPRRDGAPSEEPTSESISMTEAAADPQTCQVRFHFSRATNGRVMADTREVISFRRIEKLELVNRADELQKVNDRRVYVFISKEEPVFYRLTPTYLGGDVARQKSLYFLHEEMADRIAKAMLHAVELCGGGSKDPF